MDLISSGPATRFAICVERNDSTCFLKMDRPLVCCHLQKNRNFKFSLIPHKEQATIFDSPANFFENLMDDKKLGGNFKKLLTASELTYDELHFQLIKGNRITVHPICDLVTGVLP